LVQDFLGLAPRFFLGWMGFFVLSSATVVASDVRGRTLEGLKKIHSYEPQSVIELAHREIENGNFLSALRKLHLHQRFQPEDPEGWFLEAEVLVRLDKLRGAYLAYRKAYALTGLTQIRDKMEALESKLKKSSKALEKPRAKRSQSKSGDLPKGDEKNSSRTLESKPEPLSRGGFLILSKLRTLDSLLKRYIGLKGEMKSFDLRALLAGSVTTRPVSIVGLGEMTLVTDHVRSSLFGTAPEQAKFLEFFRKAITLAAKGETTQAIALLEKNKETMIREEFEFLIRLYNQVGLEGQAILLRIELAKKFPKDSRNLLTLARHFFQQGDSSKALHYYERLMRLDSNYKFEAESQADLIRAGGSFRLKEVFELQRKELFQK
jgi:tetratricopeptide (TPR) repeat protein